MTHIKWLITSVSSGFGRELPESDAGSRAKPVEQAR